MQGNLNSTLWTTKNYFKFWMAIAVVKYQQRTIHRKSYNNLPTKKLIQVPPFVIEQRANILSTAISHLDEISFVYENLQPTVRKVLKSLSFSENMNAQERVIQRYLTTNLREFDTQVLSWLL